MMNVFKLFIISFSVAILTACGPVQILETEPEEVVDEERIKSEWIIPDGEEQFLRTRTWNLVHQKLWVRFDFKQEQVIGKTELFLTSLENHNNELILDAKTMDFDSVYTVHPGEHLDFQQDSAIVTINLPEWHSRGDSLFIGISYVATPPDRGLYFVDPHNLDPTKPTQVWTLGQPEDNSFWFPTIDSPMERTTQETWISVPEAYKTLSNGSLVESRVWPGDSLRTDYWVMNKPHTPYLFALAVGDYSISKSWNHDVLFKYYTEPQYAQYVDLIYENTEDMLEFIETRTGVAYPWDIYAQVPVHDFIASGMENTTATILYDAVQVDERAHQDISHQGLIMHELIHQWFGNYVTAKNWANLPLNEGFANYFEILYTEYKQGQEDAAWENLDNRHQYFTEAQQMRRPIIFNRYREPEDMYDRHTYAKAGQVLRMLHDYMGDEAWWSALNAYLTRFAFDEVDVSDLQDIFEHETGEDLAWFFDQWFHQPGHPDLEISTDTTDSELRVHIRQIHDTDRQPVFTLHTTLEVKTSNSLSHKNIVINQADSVYSFTLDGNPEDVILDPERIQLAEIHQSNDVDIYIDRLNHPSVAIREDAVRQLSSKEWTEEIETAMTLVAAHDAYPNIRSIAMEALAGKSHGDLTDFALSRTYENEPDSRTRIIALHLLAHHTDERVMHHIESMTRDTSYFVAAEAIRLYGSMYPKDAHRVLSDFRDKESYQHVIRTAVAEALTNSTSREAYEILFELAQQPGDFDYIRIALGGIAGFIMEYDVKDEVAELYQSRLDDPYEATRSVARAGLEYLDEQGS